MNDKGRPEEGAARQMVSRIKPMVRESDDSGCLLCLGPGPLVTTEFCDRCFRAFVAGSHRRHEAERRLPPLEVA